MFERLADDVWLDDGPVRIVGARLSSNMTALRLPGRGVLLHAPSRLTAERRAAVEALGPVEHLVAPSLFHHLHVGDWAESFPEARVHAAAGLRDKRPDLRIDRELGGAPDPELADCLDEFPIDGCRLGETALYFRPAKTVLVADLVHNIGRPDDFWTRSYTKMAGFYDRIAISRVLRWTAFSDRDAARRSIDALLALPFERLVVGHGEPVVVGARDALASAYHWLEPSAGFRSAGR